MSQIYDAIKTFLEESQFNYDYVEDRKLFHFGLNVENGTVRVGINYDDEADYVFVNVYWDGRVPARAVPATLPVINEINCNTRFTTLCISDGDISAHTGINLDDSELSPKQMAVTLRMLVTALDDNIEKIMRAAWNAPTTPVN